MKAPTFDHLIRMHGSTDQCSIERISTLVTPRGDYQWVTTAIVGIKYWATVAHMAVIQHIS